MRVALFLFDIHDISGGGGAERFWADVFRNFPKDKENIELFFFMDEATRNALKKIGRLESERNIVIISNSKSSNQPLKNFLDAFSFITKLIFYRISILHSTYYGPHYYKRFRYLGLVPKFLRPKIVLTEVTSFTPYCYLDEKIEQRLGLRKYVLDAFFNNIRIDGIMTWYELTKKVLTEKKIVKSNPYIYAVKYCFTDTSSFKPLEKENHVIFASRLIDIKKPLWFVDAVKELIAMGAGEGWKFFIYGKGPLENEVRERIKQYGLENALTLTSAPDMRQALGHSKIFVSCQDYENFTSLSMLEAMACGNALVARDVGQTNYFLRNGVNGFVAEEDSPVGIAKALIRTMNSELTKMSDASVRIAQTEHNMQNFIGELKSFWKDVAKR